MPKNGVSASNINHRVISSEEFNGIVDVGVSEDQNCAHLKSWMRNDCDPANLLAGSRPLAFHGSPSGNRFDLGDTSESPRRSNASSTEALLSREFQSGATLNSTLANNASRSFTNSDSALPISYNSACRVPRAPSLPPSVTSKCSTGSEAKCSPPPAVPARTTSSPQKQPSSNSFSVSSALITGLRGQIFIGREWVFEKIFQWTEYSQINEANRAESLRTLSEDSKSQMPGCSMILVGGPGTGKTAIVERITEAKCLVHDQDHHVGFPDGPPTSSLLSTACNQISECLLAYHACSCQFVASINLPRVILSFRNQLTERDDAVGDFYRNKLTENSGKLNRLFNSARLCAFPDEVLSEGIFKPLAEIDAKLFAGKRFFFLVDSIDECMNFGLTKETRIPPGLSATRCPHKRYSQLSSESEKIDATEKLATGMQAYKGEQGWVSRNLIELLAVNSLFLPPWIGFLFTCRREHYSFICRMFPCSIPVVLDDLHSPLVTKDLAAFIFGRLKSELVLQASFTSSLSGHQALQILQLKSNASFLYIQIVLNAVSQCWLTPECIRSIPGTLSGLFLWLCQRLLTRLVNDSTPVFAVVKPVLSLILASPRPLTLSEIDIVLQLNSVDKHICEMWKYALSLPYFLRHEYPEFLSLQPKQWVKLLNYSELQWENVVQFTHSSLRDWILDVKYSTPVFACSPCEGHSMLALAALNQVRQKPSLSASFTWDLLYNFARSTLYNSAQALQQVTTSLKHVELDFTVDTQDNLDYWTFIHDPILVHCSFAGSSISQLIEDALNYDYREHQQRFGGKVSQNSSAGSATASGIGGGVNVPVKRQHPVGPVLMTSSDNISLIGQLCTAAFQGRLDAVRAILQSGDDIDLESRDAAGSTPLVLACRQGHTEIVRELLAAHARLDQVDQDGWSALRSAAWGGHADVVNLLLEACANVDITGSDCRTALRAAAWAGHTGIVRRLLDAGADVNRADAEGRTPVIAAAYMGFAHVIEILADTGADLNHADQDGRTALCVAAFCVPPSEAHTNVVATLLQLGADPNLGDRENVTPLIGAAQSGRRRICELCLEADANVDRTDKSGRSALVTAVVNAHLNVVQLLLFWGAAVHSIDANGRSVLSIAAACGHTEIVRELLARGLDEAHRDHMGATPLHLAAAAGHDDVVRLLLEAGSRPDETDNSGQTPLLVACQADHLHVIRLLLRPVLTLDDEAISGAAWRTSTTAVAERLLRELVHQQQEVDDIDQLTGNEEDLSSGCNGHEYLARSSLDTINRAAMDGRTPLRAAALNNNIPLVQTLLVFGADPNQQDSCGRTTLSVVVLEGLVSMAKTLLQVSDAVALSGQSLQQPCIRPADPLLADDEGRCPLHIAAWQGQIELVNLLLQVGTAVDVRDKENRTPLHSAAWQNHAAICHLLLQHGAEVDSVCSQGATALCIAAQEGHFDVCEVLLKNGAKSRQVDFYGRTPFKVAAKAGHRNICSLLDRFNGRVSSPRLRQLRRKSAAAVTQKPGVQLQHLQERQLQQDSLELASRVTDVPPGSQATSVVPPAFIRDSVAHQSRNRTRLSFEKPLNHEPTANSNTYAMSKDRESLSPLCPVTSPDGEVISAYARPFIALERATGDNFYSQESHFAHQMQRYLYSGHASQNVKFRGWPMMSGSHNLMRVSPTWCAFSAQPITGEHSLQQHLPHPSTVNSSEPSNPAVHIITANAGSSGRPAASHNSAWQQPLVFASPRTYNLQPAYVLSPHGFLIQQSAAGAFQPYFVQPAAFPAIPVSSLHDFSSPLLMSPCGTAQIVSAHAAPARFDGISVATGQVPFQTDGALHGGILPPDSGGGGDGSNRSARIVETTRLPDVSAFSGSSMLHTPPHPLELGQLCSLTSPIVNESMTYCSVTSPICHQTMKNTIAVATGLPPLPQHTNTAAAHQIGEDSINLNEVTDSEYEASVWVTRLVPTESHQSNSSHHAQTISGVVETAVTEATNTQQQHQQVPPILQSQPQAPMKKSRQFGLGTGVKLRKPIVQTNAGDDGGRKFGRGRYVDSVKVTCQEDAEILSSAVVSSKVSALLPKFSPGHGVSSGLKMKNVIQEAWKGARRRAFEKSGPSVSSGGIPLDITGGFANISSGQVDEKLVTSLQGKPEAEAYV